MASKHSAPDVAALLQRVTDELGIDPFVDGLQLVDGQDLAAIERRAPFSAGLFSGSLLRPMLIANLDGEDASSAVVRFLSAHVPPEHQVAVFDDLPGSPRLVSVLALAGKVGSGIAVHVPAVKWNKAGTDPHVIQQIVARLREPDGCPWDREQTHLSLRDATIDEAYEVTDAIDSADPGNLAEELGDLLLLITMHAQIAAEAGTFTIDDVQEAIATKIVGRHPHVFGDDTATTAADLGRIWQEAKARERSARPDKGGGKDLDGEPRSMPALTRAVRVLRKRPISGSPDTSTPDERAERLFNAVAELVAAGEDPDAVLRAALTRHASPNPDLAS